MTDLRERLHLVKERADAMRKAQMQGPLECVNAIVALSDVVHYLATIVEKHLETGEQ